MEEEKRKLLEMLLKRIENSGGKNSPKIERGIIEIIALCAKVDGRYGAFGIPIY